MLHRRCIPALLLVAVLLLHAACHAPKDLVYIGAGDFSIKKSEHNKTLIGAGIKVYNPNGYAMTLKSADVDLLLNGAKAGVMNTTEPVTLRPRDTSVVPVTVETDLAAVLPNVLQMLLSSDINVKLKGSLKAGRNRVYFNIPVDYDGTQDIQNSMK
jgi:LEA14-like dessication related protein